MLDSTKIVHWPSESLIYSVHVSDVNPYLVIKNTTVGDTGFYR